MPSPMTPIAAPNPIPALAPAERPLELPLDEVGDAGEEPLVLEALADVAAVVFQFPFQLSAKSLSDAVMVLSATPIDTILG